VSLQEELAAIDLPSAFRPFIPDERDRLRRFAAKTVELRELSFVQQGSPTLHMKSGSEGFSYVLGPDVGRERVTSALVPVRILYRRDENISFVKTVELLVDHVDETRDDSAALRALLERARQGIAAVFSNTTIVFLDRGTDDGTLVDGRQIFEDWMYGDYLHDDEQRRERIEPYRFDGSQEFTFLQLLWSLAVGYIVFSELFVEPLLDKR